MKKGLFVISRKVVVAFLLTATLSVFFTACSSDSDSDSNGAAVVVTEQSTLKEALKGIDRISMIEEDPDTVVKRRKAEGSLDYKEQLSMSFRQDVNHEVQGGETFQQRVCILFRGFDRPTIFVTEGYFWSKFNDAEDLGVNLNANMVHVEHRNFGQSYNQDKGQWQYETAAQTSADLHAVYQALKPILKGKWMSTGTSKNGITSIQYAYYYPNDMSLAAAFCSPFMLNLNDERYGHYLFNEVSTEENRELMKTAIRKALTGGENGDVYKAVGQKLSATDAPLRYTEYVYDVFDTFFQMFQYTPNNGQTDELQRAANDGENLVELIGTTVVGNRDERFYTYFVDCAKNIGWVNPGYEYFADLLDGTSFNCNDVLPMFMKEEDAGLLSTYDGSLNNDIFFNYFRTTTCPVLLFYSKDDPWSGGMPTNLSPSVKIVVNPIGAHNPKLNDPVYCPAEIKQEVMNFVSTYLNAQ